MASRPEEKEISFTFTVYSPMTWEEYSGHRDRASNLLEVDESLTISEISIRLRLLGLKMDEISKNTLDHYIKTLNFDTSKMLIDRIGFGYEVNIYPLLLYTDPVLEEIE